MLVSLRPGPAVSSGAIDSRDHSTTTGTLFWLCFSAYACYLLFTTVYDDFRRLEGYSTVVYIE